MTRKTETFDLESEADRLEQKVDRLADDAAELADEDDNKTVQRKLSGKLEEGHSAEQQLVGVLWALNPEDGEDRAPYEEITLGGLTAGEYAQVGDYTRGVEKLNQSSVSQHMEAENARRNIFAAAGLVEAPFLDVSHTADSELYEKYSAVCDLSPQFVFWIEQRVDDLTTPDVEGNGFLRRVEERTETKTHIEPTPEQS